MYDLLNDKILTITDKEIESLMDSIDYVRLFENEDFNDDVYQKESKIKENYPFEWLVLNNFWTLVYEKYIKQTFLNKTIELAEIKLAEGYSKSNFKWHTDKLGVLNSDEVPVCDQDIICLYYFNSTDFGPLCYKYDTDPTVRKIYPQKGLTVLINEYHPGLIHKVEKYNVDLGKRYVARVSFKVKN